MSAHLVKSALRPAPDGVLSAIADYARNFTVESQPAYQTARYCLMDSLACALQALAIPACRKLLGPVVPGAVMPGGARVPGTSFELDPVQAAFNIGTLIRWLDFNDTWLAAEWGHPSDNLGGILAVADYLARNAVMSGRTPPSVRALLTAMIKAHEIQGVLALENSFNRVGLDHVLLVRVASTAVVAGMLGASLDQIVNALSNAWIDGGALRTYRHAPNTGSRKSWAAGDATSRGVRHALMALNGEMGYPSALSAKTWGFYDVLFKGKAFSLPQPFGSYVMENVLFKISYPAEFHAQTAVEAAMALHPQVRERLADIERIVIETQEPGVRIIDQVGPLANPADRDHCIQYMDAVIAVGGIGERPYLVDDAHARLLGLDDDALDVGEPLPDLRMQGHRRLDCRLGVELGRVGDLEQHVLHDVAAEGLRQRERPALEEHVVEAPGLRRQRGRVAHLPVERHERMAHPTAGGIARRPALARAGVGGMPIGAQRAAVDPGVGQRVHDLIEAGAEHARDHRRRGDAHQQHMIESHAVEAVLQRQHPLDLVRLDHGGEQCAHARRGPARHDGVAREVIRHREDAAEIVRGMAPLGGEPGVVEVEPADQRADVEGRLHRVELEGGARDARAARHDRSGHHGTQELAAGRNRERLQGAGEAVHEAVARGLVRRLALDGEIAGVVGDGAEHPVRCRTQRGLDQVCGHVTSRSSAHLQGRCPMGTNSRLSGPV